MKSQEKAGRDTRMDPGTPDRDPTRKQLVGTALEEGVLKLSEEAMGCAT